MPGAVLIVEDDRQTAEDLRRFLSPTFHCVATHGAAEAIAAARKQEIAVALVDLNLGKGTDGFDVIAKLREIDPRTAVIIVTSDDTEASLERAQRMEVEDYIHKSVGLLELLRAVRRSLVLRHASQRARFLEGERPEAALVAESPAMKRVLGAIAQAARHRAPVLIAGPVGAGKMAVARAVHERSRAGRPFRIVHAARLTSASIADNELFGHEPGAYTDAATREPGAFETAEDGTLLLDDIDYLPRETQAKLLHPLQERTVRRLGGSAEIPVRCRILVTTNKDIAELVSKGRFLPDLLDRLRGGQEICVPGIEERRDDLPALVRAIAAAEVAEIGKRLDEISEDFLAAVGARRWRSVRELEHAVRRAVGLADEGRLAAGDLPEAGAGAVSFDAVAPGGPAGGAEGDLESVVARAKLHAVERALARCGGDKKEAARRLGITVQWLNAILRSKAGPAADAADPPES